MKPLSILVVCVLGYSGSLGRPQLGTLYTTLLEENFEELSEIQ